MRSEEHEQVAAAAGVLNRARSVTVRLTARWTRLDDLEPEDEQSLQAALREAWEGWAGARGISDAEVRGPEISTAKLDFYSLDLGEP